MPQDLQPLTSPASAPGRAASRRVDRWDEAKFHRVLDEVPAGAYVCDRDGRILYCNRRAVDIWGREPMLHDARDRFCGSFRLFTGDGTPLARDQCWAARALLEDRECNGIEVVIERPDGRRVTALAHANPIHDEDGALVGVVNILMDVTDRIRDDRTKSDFLASLGHELRSPLGPITNAVHILRSKPAPDAQSKWALDLIERQVEDLVGLIDLVSEVSRLTRDDPSVERAPYGVAALLAGAEERMRPLLARKGQTCSLRLPAASATAFGDGPLLQRAIESLIQSASRLQRSGEAIELDVTVTASGWSVVTGPREGGEESSAPPERFESDGIRGHITRTTLIFAERVAELHGGRLIVHVRRDESLVYELSLPLRPPSLR